MPEIISVPQGFLERYALGLEVWQWGALLVLVVCSAILGVLLSRLARKLLARFTRRTPFEWDCALVERARGPLCLAIAIALCLALLPLIELGSTPCSSTARRTAGESVVV